MIGRAGRVVDRASDEEIRALAARWPREFSAATRADSLAADWIRSREAARAAGLPPFARHELTRSLADALFEARRARRLIRGLEPAELRLAAQAGGVARARGAHADLEAPGARISRLLLISQDGADRFYRKINDLHENYEFMLEVLVVACDASELARGAYGAGEQARALLLDHKAAVVRVLESLDAFQAVFEGAGGAPEIA